MDKPDTNCNSAQNYGIQIYYIIPSYEGHLIFLESSEGYEVCN